MEYLTIQEMARKWNLSERRLQAICASGRIEGVKKFGSCWAIPVNAKKPDDQRIKSRKYIKKKQILGEDDPYADIGMDREGQGD